MPSFCRILEIYLLSWMVLATISSFDTSQKREKKSRGESLPLGDLHFCWQFDSFFGWVVLKILWENSGPNCRLHQVLVKQVQVVALELEEFCNQILTIRCFYCFLIQILILSSLVVYKLLHNSWGKNLNKMVCLIRHLLENKKIPLLYLQDKIT